MPKSCSTEQEKPKIKPITIKNIKDPLVIDTKIESPLECCDEDKHPEEDNYVPPIVEDVSSDESEYGHDDKNQGSSITKFRCF